MSSDEQKKVRGVKRTNGHFNSNVDVRDALDSAVLEEIQLKMFGAKRLKTGVETSYDEKKHVMKFKSGDRTRTMKIRQSLTGANTTHTGSYQSCLGEQDPFIFDVVEKLFNPKTVLKTGKAWDRQAKLLNAVFAARFDMDAFAANLSKTLADQADYVYVVADDGHFAQSSARLVLALVDELYGVPLILRKGRTICFSPYLSFKRKGTSPTLARSGQLHVYDIKHLMVEMKSL